MKVFLTRFMLVIAVGTFGSLCQPVHAQLTEMPEIGSATIETEVIVERYPNGKVKIQRNVAQDSKGNYTNHGAWSGWDPNGRLISSGEFHKGKRDGTWVRWHYSTGGTLLNNPEFRGFRGPFLSEAQFKRGKLNGTWTFYDSTKQKCSEWTFVNGKIHGKAIWYFPNGIKRKEIDYTNGKRDGHYVDWGPDGRVTKVHYYINDRRLALKVGYYPSNGPTGARLKKGEGWVLHAQQIIDRDFDWWKATFTKKVLSVEGKDEKHGVWTSWYPNGQVQFQGRYEHDRRLGTWTWWHANGQKKLVGSYSDGRPHGGWTWWHPNGQKQIVGEYLAGMQQGKWKMWDKDGKLSDQNVSAPATIAINKIPQKEPTFDDLELADPQEDEYSQSAKRDEGETGLGPLIDTTGPALRAVPLRVPTPPKPIRTARPHLAPPKHPW